MSEAASGIYVALIVQIGGLLLWLLQRRKGRKDDDVAYQQRVVELSAEISHLWGERIADRDRQIVDKDRQLEARDRAIDQRDARIRRLLAKGPAADD